MVTDKLNTATSAIITVSTEFATMEILKGTGAGFGRVPTAGGANVQVGLGGINSEGRIFGPLSGPLAAVDSRNVAITPFQDAAHMQLHFKTNVVDSLSDGGTFHGLLNLQQYADRTGGSHHQLGFTDNGNIWHRLSTSTSWGGWQKVWDAGNDGTGSGLDADLLDGKHASAFALASNTASYEFGSNDNGNYHILGNGLMICTQRMYLGNYLSGFTIMGRWTFPSAFKHIPTISVTPRTSWGNMTPTAVQEDLNGTLQLYTESATYADMAWIRANGNAFVNGSKKYIALFAIGVPA